MDRHQGSRSRCYCDGVAQVMYSGSNLTEQDLLLILCRTESGARRIPSGPCRPDEPNEFAVADGRYANHRHHLPEERLPIRGRLTKLRESGRTFRVLGVRPTI